MWAALETFLRVAPAITNILLIFSPLPTVRNIIKQRTTETLPPLPYFSLVANGFLWMVYGIASDGNLTIAAPNAVALVMGAYYTHAYATHSSKAFELRNYFIVTALSVMFVIFVFTTTDSTRARAILGKAGSVVCVVMLFGPLQALGQVLRDRSTRSLPFPMAVATLVNCCMWSAFGWFVVSDVYIWGPNGLGIMSGALQLLMFALFGHHKETHSKLEDSDIELMVSAGRT